MSMYTTDPFHLVVETGLHLEELTVPDRSTLAHGSDAGKSVLGTTEESNDESLVAGDLEAVRVRVPALGTGPLAVSPHRALDLAALGHLNTVERVAVGAEQAGDEVIATTELATTGVELLPPILVVAAGCVESVADLGSGFPWLLAQTRVKIVEGVLGLFHVSLHADEEGAWGAGGPTPLVHRGGPDHLVNLLFASGDTTRWDEAFRTVEDSGRTARAETSEAITPANLPSAAIRIVTTTVVGTVFVETGARATILHVCCWDTTCVVTLAFTTTSIFTGGHTLTLAHTTFRVFRSALLNSIVEDGLVETWAANLFALGAGGH